MSKCIHRCLSLLLNYDSNRLVLEYYFILYFECIYLLIQNLFRLSKKCKIFNLTYQNQANLKISKINHIQNHIKIID